MCLCEREIMHEECEIIPNRDEFLSPAMLTIRSFMYGNNLTQSINDGLPLKIYVPCYVQSIDQLDK